jgi:hypothetical protein
MLYTLQRTKTNKENTTQQAKKDEKHGHHQQAWMNSPNTDTTNKRG